ncbi:hypothetical protein HPB52_009327 [Rhipicephalus sanguineus]|uniref:Nlr family card domain protein n=1 Tax=Rhipicephalus sanguineus TaxID=34632 RepID=A0A9D4QE62_RHISA|nr:hypothetical protein HPB52_009327 [Rhipicephalus sanguineus]
MDSVGPSLEHSAVVWPLRNPSEKTSRDSFFTTLSHQSQLKELNLLTSSLQCNSYPYAFAEYLATTTVLKVLVVSVTNELVQKAVLKGVSENSSIEELFLNDFTGNQESTAIVARMISSNRVLRKLTVYTKDDTEPGMPTTYYCWILALFENETLEEVKFPLLILSPSQWSVLFQALPTKQNLKKVHIDAGVDGHQLVPLLCTELISSGSDEKVSISCLSFRYDVGFLQCKAFSGANFFFADDRAVAALRILPSCRHLTSLTMHIQVGKLTISSALASLLESTTALRKLKLLVNTGAEVGAGDDSQWWSRVLEALSHNDSLRELLYTLFFPSDRITAAFADCVRGSKNIRWVEFDGGTTEHANAFMRHLAKDIAKNYTLLTVVCYGNVDADFARDWLAVQETTRRNSNLVARAARLLKASRFDRYVIRALERVSLYPALMDEVAEQVKTDKAELASLVQDRLRGTKSLDGFMRFTGVVRESVVCHPSDDGRMQLDSLNEDCWRHIRKYLYIDDVK